MQEVEHRAEQAKRRAEETMGAHLLFEVPEVMKGWGYILLT